MKLRKCTAEEMENLGLRKSYKQILMEFADSGLQCVTVEGLNVSARSAQAMFGRLISQCGMYHIRTSVRDDRIYLINEKAEE